MTVILVGLIGVVLGYFIREITAKENVIEEDELDEEEVKKYKEIKKAFNELMEYDYDKALGSDINE